MGEYVLSLTQVALEDEARVGAKAVHLAHLARAGLPVPPGFCITVAAYRLFLNINNLSPAELDLTPSDKEIPPEVVRAVKEAYEFLAPSPAPVAVRSSAIAEDLPEASFAGQYETFLNVIGLGPLLTAIRGCWAALQTDRVRAYAARHGLNPHRLEMAVLVQQQVAAETAGVLFTLNPVTGDEREMVIEAVWGLGEPLAAGEVEPDRYTVTPYDRQVLEQRPGAQCTMRVAAPEGGTTDVPLPPERCGRPVLSQEQLLELAELGYRVQALYGYPQDIEWALADGRFFLLQSRPLTAFQFDPQLGQWTSANHREVLPGFPSPLSLSLSLEIEYGRALATMFRDLKMGDAPRDTVWGRPFFGRPYWNVGMVKQFAARIPGFKERTFDATVGIEPTYEGDGLTTPWTLRTILRALPILFALNKRYETCWQEAAAFARRFLEEEEPQVAQVDPARLSDPALAEWVRRMADLHQRTNFVAITVSLLAAQAQDEFAATLARLNRNLAPDQVVRFGDLTAGIREGESPALIMGTAKPMLELWGLARQAGEDARLASAIIEDDPEGIPSRLATTPAGRALWTEVEAFIRRYHYMGRVDEDLAQPRWDEDPSFVLATLQTYVRSLVSEPTPAQDPTRQLAAQRERAEVEEARAMDILSKGWRRVWPFARHSFQQQLHRVRRYIWWREEMRVIASMAFYHCRRFFLELGRRWAAGGWLSQPDQVFLLRWPEIEAALEGRLEAAELQEGIDRYLRLRAAYRNFEPPNVIGRGACLADTRPQASTCLKGTPCSSGRASGPARVVHNLEEAQALRDREILVAPYTNPGWTPLFRMAAGLVIEAGGLLSHGAVVAREYGIPTVIGIEGATRLLNTGQVVTVDGSLGIVEVIRQSP